MTDVTTARRAAVRADGSAAWRDRSGRLYEELKRPARAMIRRAFRGAFTDDEVEDVYSNAWLGTLRALEHRHHELQDDEIRKYLLTAVAHHASKEIRRRRRRPVSPLDGVHAVADEGLPPDERAAKLEESQVARDVLSSLPPRRRAVMLLRYGWGLEPRQVCGLVKGLSPRAYRKEITRGVDEIATKLRLVQSGRWCSEREPLLKAYVAGLADEEQRRQAQQHLSHCRKCCDFVGKLAEQLHDVGTVVAIPSAAGAIADGRWSIADRVIEVAHRAKDSAASVFGRGAGEGTQEASSQILSLSAGARGAGAAGTGLLAKAAGMGAASKLTAMCLGGGVAASACLATGVVPAGLPGSGADRSKIPPPALSAREAADIAHTRTTQLGVPYEAPQPPPEPQPAPEPPAPPPEPPPATTTVPTTTVATTTTPAPIAPTTPPTEQEFDVASAASSPDTGTSSGSGDSGSGSAVEQEFGP